MTLQPNSRLLDVRLRFYFEQMKEFLIESGHAAWQLQDYLQGKPD
jgi:hypothetical protein